jgi:hypothetical protein
MIGNPRWPPTIGQDIVKHCKLKNVFGGKSTNLNVMAVSFIGGGTRVPRENHQPVASH